MPEPSAAYPRRQRYLVDIQAAERHIAEHGLVDAEGSRRAV